MGTTIITLQKRWEANFSLIFISGNNEQGCDIVTAIRINKISHQFVFSFYYLSFSSHFKIFLSMQNIIISFSSKIKFQLYENQRSCLFGTSFSCFVIMSEYGQYLQNYRKFFVNILFSIVAKNLQTASNLRKLLISFTQGHQLFHA